MIDIEILGLVIFIGVFIISIFIAYNKKQMILGKPYIDTKNIEVLNRIASLIILSLFLYLVVINKDTKNYDLKVISGILPVIAAIIILYVTLIESNTVIANPTI